MTDTAATRRQLRLRIEGRVQGVGYRDWMITTARRLGLDGWVRNRRDGSVEALIEGPVDDVEALVDAARNGPPMARVVTVDRQPSDEPVAGQGFERRPTA